jgi:hypothetical protein
MGWWKVSGTDDVVGDEVYSLLRNAALAVASEYEQNFGSATHSVGMGAIALRRGRAD